MFNFNKPSMLEQWQSSRLKNQDIEINELNQELEDAKEEIRKLEDEHESFLNIIEDEIRDCPIVIDWVGMDVVSVERHMNEDGFPMTVVTYKDYQGELQEWFYHCSEQWHTQLTVEFGKYLLKRK
jgi:predicted RNA-binding protein with EMAP domain